MAEFSGAIQQVVADAENSKELRSKSILRIIDLVSEGEIEGLADATNPAKSIYLNGTPLQNANGSYNFSGVAFETRPGTNDQTYIENSARGSGAVEAELAVGVEVKNTTPITRTVSNSDVNAVRVTLSVGALFKQQTDGDVVGQSVEIAIDVQSNGGPWVTGFTNTISGKALSKYQRSYLVPLSAYGPAPWNIRVRRVTEDSTNERIQDKTYWDSYTEIVYAKLRYPNSALVSSTFDASLFSGVPTRAYDLKLKKIQVPVNYDPVARTYTGVWNGTFKTVWSDNPAWVFYDLVTSERYGLGGYITSGAVDKWALYTIGQYCDQLVPNGFGGTEPRFTCNMYLQTQREAYQVIRDLASCFRAMVYWASGSLTLSQDAPSDPVALFTQANVIDGLFTYSGSSAKARHTVALVTWNDPADQYRQKVEYVEDVDGISRLGVIQTEVVAFGCTSRGQANRVGRWLLFSERMESETVTFRTGVEGALARPGDVIKVADSSRAGIRLGGRVSSATTTSVTVDQAPTLGATAWTLHAMLPDGTIGTAAVSSASGDTLTLATALSAAPQSGAQWVLSSSAVEPQIFRVVSITEQEGGIVEITALAHEPDKYDAVENGLVLQPRDYSLLDDPPDETANGKVSEWLYQTLTDVRVGAQFTWDQVARANTYEVIYTRGSDNPVTVTVDSNALDLTNAQAGDYTVTVRAVSSAGKKSTPYTFVKSILGKTALPADVTGLQMTIQGETGQLQWNTHADLDVRIGGQISVRYSEQLTGALWNTSLPVADFPGNATSGVVPLRVGSYLVKATDSTGNLSANAALVVTNAANISQFNAVASSQQEPTFAGTKTSLVVLDDKLQLDQAVLWDDYVSLDDVADVSGDLVESGEYEFDSYIDTGAVYTSRVTANFSVISFGIENQVDNWGAIDDLGSIDEGLALADYMDSWTSVDAIPNWDLVQQAADAKLQFYIATTTDDPAGLAPAWSDWRLFYVGDYTARAFKFKVALSRGRSNTQQVVVSNLGVTVDVPDRVESDRAISVPSGGLSVTFANAFFATPAVAVTANDMATGDYAQITAKTPAGFTIQFKNSAGTGVARTMDWIARGFGYRN